MQNEQDDSENQKKARQIVAFKQVQDAKRIPVGEKPDSAERDDGKFDRSPASSDSDHGFDHWGGVLLAR
jgi:hypothetical protein